MRPVLAITHLPVPQLGLVDESLAERGLPVQHLHIDDGNEMPEVENVSAIVSFGGQMSALDSDRLPFLALEVELLGRALERDVPILGLCLGAQLLATAGGGGVRRLPESHIAWEQLHRVPAVDRDPVFSSLPPRFQVLEWHRDAIELPTHASVLAQTDGPGCSVFRLGRHAWGSQTHLELTDDVFETWLRDPVEARQLAEAGIETEVFRRETLETLPGQIAGARPVFGRFADLVVARERASPPRPPLASYGRGNWIGRGRGR